MSKAIRIEISDPPTPDIVHRFRNFGEGVYRAAQGTCSVDIHEINAAITSLLVRDIETRHLGSVTEMIKRELKRHNLTESARLVRI